MMQSSGHPHRAVLAWLHVAAVLPQHLPTVAQDRHAESRAAAVSRGPGLHRGKALLCWLTEYNTRSSRKMPWVYLKTLPHCCHLFCVTAHISVPAEQATGACTIVQMIVLVLCANWDNMICDILYQTAVEALMHPYVRSPPPSPQQHSRGGSVANAEIGTNGCRCAQSDDSQEKQTEDSQNEENAATSQPPPANAAFQFPLSSALLTRSASYKSLSHVVANDDDGDISKIGKQEGEGAGHVPTVYKKRKGFASDGEDTAVCSNGVKDDGRVRTADDDREECSIGRSTRSTRSKTVSTLPSSSSSAVSGHDSADNSRIASSSSSSTQLRRKRRSGGGGGDDDEVSGRPPLPRPAAAATSQRGNKK